jgi:hypothetical protein
LIRNHVTCALRIGAFDGVPLFDANFTDGQGVSGRFGPLGSDAEIGLAETEPLGVTEGVRAQAGPVAEARQRRHKAVVLLTRGSHPGLFLLNAGSFTRPIGPPTLQVSSVESGWLKEQAQQRVEATLVAHANRAAAEALNVTVKISGSNPALAPLVFMAPRSGWWQCVSEQGSRLACWLEAIRVLAAGKPARDCFFVALSGHELGLLGIYAYLERRGDLVKRAHAWIFFGSDNWCAATAESHPRVRRGASAVDGRSTGKGRADRKRENALRRRSSRRSPSRPAGRWAVRDAGL